MEDILALLNIGLQKSGSLRTAATLGDRSTYIGMSDIGKGVDCLRAAVASKLSAQSAAGSGQLAEHQEQANLQRELRLQRGHWFEAGILETFSATGQPFIHQLTITSMNDVPVIAHPDFVFADNTGEIQIVELKSCENIPESAYAAHEVQLFGQMGLLMSLQHGRVQRILAQAGQAQAQYHVAGAKTHCHRRYPRALCRFVIEVE